jgi:hypothetical protein
MGHPYQHLAYVTLNRRHVLRRKVEDALCVKDVEHGKREKCECISTMAIETSNTQMQEKYMSLLERIWPH